MHDSFPSNSLVLRNTTRIGSWRMPAAVRTRCGSRNGSPLRLGLRPGMRVLDLGCGRASSSIFLRREYGVQVWATDLWFSAAENIQRIRDAGVEDGVFPLHADARSLPFAPSFFDAIVCIDSFPYYGTDDLYLNYLAQFVKPGAPIGIAGAGWSREIEGPVPEHLRAWWTQDLWALPLCGVVAATLGADGHRGCRIGRDNAGRLAKSGSTGIGPSPQTTPRKSSDRSRPGPVLGYVRLVGRRRGEVKLEEYCWPDTLKMVVPPQYTKKPLLRSPE